MANAYPVNNVNESIVRSLSASRAWLMSIENKANVGVMDAVVQVGDATAVIVDAASANTNSDKSITSVVADKGVRHEATLTTAPYYQPVKWRPDEMDTMIRNGTLQREADKDAIVQMDAVLKAITLILIDALSDGTIGITAALPSAFASREFAQASAANQAANMSAQATPWGTFIADNGGELPDWVACTPITFGNLIGYGKDASPLVATPNGPTAYSYLGVPLYVVAATGSKWGAVSKSCMFFGAARHIVFKLRDIGGGEQVVLDPSTGFWTLPLTITATYGVDFTTTTGLARAIGEVTSGTS